MFLVRGRKEYDLLDTEKEAEGTGQLLADLNMTVR